eukprot:4569625-Pleurochrysis_carterae.AAC.1
MRMRARALRRKLRGEPQRREHMQATGTSKAVQADALCPQDVSAHGPAACRHDELRRARSTERSCDDVNSPLRLTQTRPKGACKRTSRTAWDTHATLVSKAVLCMQASVARARARWAMGVRVRVRVRLRAPCRARGRPRRPCAAWPRLPGSPSAPGRASDASPLADCSWWGRVARQATETI